MYPIRIMQRDFTLLAEINQYESSLLTRSWHGIGSIELRINRHTEHADKLLRGNIIFPHNHMDKGFVIRHKELELNEQGKITENWIIRALPLKSWLAQRITYPPAHTGNDNKQADAESVMLHYVTNNVVSPADMKRKIDDIAMSTNLLRGINVSWQSRYKNLAEELAEISLLSGLGWNVSIDYANKRYVFDVLESRNLVYSQSELPPAVFSPEFGTLKQLNYLESDLNYQNHAIVAGQGEGKDRRIIEVGESVGSDRYELFVDARDIEEETRPEEGDAVPRPVADIEADLVNRGNQKLAEHVQEMYLEGQVPMGEISEKIPKVISSEFKDARLDDSKKWESESINLQTKSYFPDETNILSWGTNSTQHEIADGVISVYVDKRDNAKGVRINEKVTADIVKGKTYTLSFDYKSDSVNELRYMYLLSSLDGNSGIGIITATDNLIPDGKWHRVTKTFVASKNQREVDVLIATDPRNTNVSLGVFSLKRLKLEVGEATSWTPSPEDNIPWYCKSKTLDLKPVRLSNIGRYQSSNFTFTTETPKGTTAVIEYSLDNAVWSNLNNGDALPFNEGDWLADRTLYLRQRLTTSDQLVTPVIRGFKYVINGYIVKKKVSTARLEYGVDYDLGDMVTLQNKEWGVTLDARITEVKEIYERDKAPSIELVFGNDRPTLISKIKSEIAGIRNEIVR